MRKVKMNTLIARVKRKMGKEELLLKKHKAGTKDYLMNGRLFAMLVEPYNNTIEAYWDYEGFIQWCRNEDILRADEEVAE